VACRPCGLLTSRHEAALPLMSTDWACPLAAGCCRLPVVSAPASVHGPPLPSPSPPHPTKLQPLTGKAAVDDLGRAGEAHHLCTQGGGRDRVVVSSSQGDGGGLEVRGSRHARAPHASAKVPDWQHSGMYACNHATPPGFRQAGRPPCAHAATHPSQWARWAQAGEGEGGACPGWAWAWSPLAAGRAQPPGCACGCGERHQPWPRRGARWRSGRPRPGSWRGACSLLVLGGVGLGAGVRGWVVVVVVVGWCGCG